MTAPFGSSETHKLTWLDGFLGFRVGLPGLLCLLLESTTVGYRYVSNPSFAAIFSKRFAIFSYREAE